MNHNINKIKKIRTYKANFNKSKYKINKFKEIIYKTYNSKNRTIEKLKVC